MKTNKLLQSHCIFPSNDIIKTAEYYEKFLGFTSERYLDAAEPHICLYRDDTEIILIEAKKTKVLPNRLMYGYGYDAYFITREQVELQKEFTKAGVKIIKPLTHTDYNNAEFVIEDIDGRWIAFGIKIK